MQLSYNLKKLHAETTAAIADLFTVTSEATRQFESGEYFLLYARGSKRIQSILGAEREILILGNAYEDQQARSLKFARRVIADSDGRLESTICMVVHQDPRGNAKLKRWGREIGLAVIPVYAAGGILPRGQELERMLSYEFFTQDPFDVTGPVANDTQFFGRRAEAQDLARKLHAGHIRSCFGIRKIGKTSILHRVLGELKAHYDAATLFVDCQRDDIFRLDAPSLLYSISQTLKKLHETGQPYLEANAEPYSHGIAEASKLFQASLLLFDKPVIIAFDEIDYVTPGNTSAAHWRHDFLEFWRNFRAAYHAAARSERVVSLLISGVSSRWFSVESIDGVENAALAFVPEEYLSPLPRGASKAMIKSIGGVAGLRFEDAALEAISSFCSDMPFWIRKTCSSLHSKIDVAGRPTTLSSDAVGPLLDQYGKDEGATLARVAMQHLFRVYPELRKPTFTLLGGGDKDIAAHTMRTLVRYGVATNDAKISGTMMRMGLEMLFEEDAATAIGVLADTEAKAELPEWAEELAAISVRRNLIERSLRSIVINFLRVASLGTKDGPTAKASVLACIQQKRRAELEPFQLDVIADKLFSTLR